LGSNFTFSTSEYTYGFSFNSTTVSGFDINNYISSGGDVKVRFYSNAYLYTANLYIDGINIMTGTVNGDNSKCEISFGSGTVGDCSNTRDMKEAGTLTPATNYWNITSSLGFPSNR
jgi:hypothetical protein